MVLTHRFSRWRQMHICITPRYDFGGCEGYARMRVGESLFIQIGRNDKPLIEALDRMVCVEYTTHRLRRHTAVVKCVTSRRQIEGGDVDRAGHMAAGDIDLETAPANLATPGFWSGSWERTPTTSKPAAWRGRFFGSIRFQGSSVDGGEFSLGVVVEPRRARRARRVP